MSGAFLDGVAVGAQQRDAQLAAQPGRPVVRHVTAMPFVPSSVVQTATGASARRTNQ